MDPLDVVDAVGRLVSHSLVVTAPAAAGESRFRLLESVRDFAAEQVPDPAQIRLAHAARFAHLAEVLDGDFQTDRIDVAVEAMRAAWPNLRAAVGYALDEGAPALAHRIIRAVGAYADVFQLYEVLDWCARADLDGVLDDPAFDRTVTADALAIEARMLAHRGDHAAARVRAERAHERCETHATLLSIVWCAYYRGDLDLVVRSAARLQELSRSERGFDRGCL